MVIDRLFSMYAVLRGSKYVEFCGRTELLSDPAACNDDYGEGQMPDKQLQTVICRIFQLETLVDR